MAKGKRKKGPKHQSPHRNKYKVPYTTGEAGYAHSRRRSANYYGAKK